MKKKWQKPELVVLLRGEPNEAVLTGCKLKESGSGPNPFFDGCKLEQTGAPDDCARCFSWNVPS